MSNDTTYPYSDNDMVYDDNKHMYIITVDGVLNNLNENIIELLGGDKNEADIWLLENSFDIYYGLVYKYSTVQTKRIKEYLLAKEGNLRDIIKEALLAQIRYSIRSGANLLKDQHGVNIEKGFALNEKEFKGDRGISRMSKYLLEQEGMLYRGYMYISIGDDEYHVGY